MPHTIDKKFLDRNANIIYPAEYYEWCVLSSGPSLCSPYFFPAPSFLFVLSFSRFRLLSLSLRTRGPGAVQPRHWRSDHYGTRKGYNRAQQRRKRGTTAVGGEWGAWTTRAVAVCICICIPYVVGRHGSYFCTRHDWCPAVVVTSSLEKLDR